MAILLHIANGVLEVHLRLKWALKFGYLQPHTVRSKSPNERQSCALATKSPCVFDKKISKITYMAHAQWIEQLVDATCIIIGCHCKRIPVSDFVDFKVSNKTKVLCCTRTGFD